MESSAVISRSQRTLWRKNNRQKSMQRIVYPFQIWRHCARGRKLNNLKVGRRLQFRPLNHRSSSQKAMKGMENG
ncbi:hypothetical protein HZS_7301 [Henneguya salminicola]|nr:hypothetical protein HZS_7301 [Henneguya salminicola]